ncbi:predicted protein [Sclerotinia sclerotiorum 1980 UF-70]|uniref:2EXR domain-containing protein n=2 Tax=Sclerotinia sclerotiorum (strain ATCC 18683 / 1980 / Ss-1) TaxID=665079 RepID=A7EEY4_SCLS1|nr:predicted protein [Sclerotinia sclerotiorum 1980 UF-70]APA12509.1 hypothetical protein sscle_09g072790 [Sclerotinia sclerotiorum 1980 UF-70]EDO01400.1 predicted protein [Sclerotinia sclerotiorum 1980 UF-70]
MPYTLQTYAGEVNGEWRYGLYSPPPPRTFTRFNQLPPEIRVMIWDYAFPNTNVVRGESTDGNENGNWWWLRWLSG